MDDHLIRDQLLTMLIAGHDTSTALLSWALYLLGKHPAVMEKARAEVDSVLGDEIPTLEQVAGLRYLDQIVDETMRLYPPIHLGSRVAAIDLDFQGYTIPAGTRIMYSIFLTQRMPQYWDNPDAFKPERFEAEAKRAQTPYAFLPFGGGPRNCIGAAFAQVEAKVVLARLLQHYHLTLTPKRVRMFMGATLEPRPGVWMTVQRR
jgi:cytochrome P450